MAAASSQDRTERPTPRKRREARREGKHAKSQEIGAALSLVVAFVGIRYLAPVASRHLATETSSLLRLAGEGRLVSEMAQATLSMLVVGLVPFLAVATVAGIAGGVGQVGLTLAPKAAQPKLSNLSLKRGLQRFKPSVMAWDLARTALKLGLLTAVIWGPLTEWMDTLAEPLGIGASLAKTGGQIGSVVLRSTILAIGIAAADYGVNRFRWSKELKMTRHEVKEEYKHQEGDPLVKSQRRRRAAELSRTRMFLDVALADVVVANPTHFAVALVYGAGDAAPKVVAKGANLMAARIKREAYRNGVTVVEDKPLAQALFRKVRVGHYVPAALYEAVATVLAVAYRRRGRRAA